MTAPTGRTFACDPVLVERWSELTQDHNPLHIDPEYAAGTPFGVPIVQGHLLAALVLDELRASGVNRGRVSIRFRAPVPVGATVRVDVTGAGAGATVTVDGSTGAPLEVEIGPAASGDEVADRGDVSQTP